MKQAVIGLLTVIFGVGDALASTIRPIPRPDPIQWDCPEDETSEQQCLICAIYHEARGEHFDGQMAVAVVIMNRVESSRYPDTICEVVWQKGWVSRIQRYIGQFSFTTDGRSDRMHDRGAVALAEEAIRISTILYETNGIEEHLGLTYETLYYHAEWVDPFWNDIFTPVVQIGTHQFYANL